MSAEEKRASIGYIYLSPNTVSLKRPIMHRNLVKNTSVVTLSHTGERQSVERTNVLTEQLKGIRNQLVRSLIRVRELEDQVQSIPALKKRVADLTSQVAKQKSFSDYLVRLLTMSPHHDNHEHDGVTTFLSSSTDSRFISVDENNPLNENSVAGSSGTTYLNVSLGMPCKGITTNCHGQVIGHNCALQVATKLKNFVDGNYKSHHRWFDENRLGEFLQCCRDANWQHILEMLHITGPTPSPLPAPPSAVELEFSIVTECLNDSVNNMESYIPHIGKVFGETQASSHLEDRTAYTHHDLESCELSWDPLEDSIVIDRYISLPLLGVDGQSCLLYRDPHVLDTSCRMFMASGKCENSKEPVSIICVSILQASYSIFLERKNSRMSCLTMKNKGVSLKPTPKLKDEIPGLSLQPECYAGIIGVRTDRSLVKQSSIVCDVEPCRNTTQFSYVNDKSLVYSVIETTDELVVSETKEVSIPCSSTLVQNATGPGVSSALGANQHSADMKEMLVAVNNISASRELKPNARPTDLRPKTHIPPPGSLTIKLTGTRVSLPETATSETRIGEVQSAFSIGNMEGAVLSSCKFSKRPNAVNDRKTPESQRGETGELSKSADRTETNRLSTGKLIFPMKLSKEQVQTDHRENVKKDRYQTSTCAHNTTFIASCGMWRPRLTPQVKFTQPTYFNTAGLATKTRGDDASQPHKKISSWKFVKLSKNKRRNLDTSECDVGMIEAGKLTAKETCAEPDNPQHDDGKQQQMEESPPRKTATGLVSVAFLAACQTLAVWLEDSITVTSKAMNEATEAVRRIWFEVTSGPTAEASRVVAHIEALQCLPICPVDRIVNMVDHTGNTALHYAVCHGRWSVVEALIASCPGIDVDTFNRAGYTPSMLAAVVVDQPADPESEKALEQLLSRADLSLVSKTQQKQSVLMLAAIHGRVSLVQRLLKMHKVQVNQKDSEGSTALMAAVEHNHLRVVHLLLCQPDLDAEMRDNDGCTALDIALARRHHEIALMIYATVKMRQLSPRSRRVNSQNLCRPSGVPAITMDAPGRIGTTTTSMATTDREAQKTSVTITDCKVAVCNQT